MRTTKIFISDAHVLTRAGIRSVLSKQIGVQVIGEAGSAFELKSKLKINLPDLLILDFHTNDKFCIEDIEFVRKNFPLVNILVVSANQNKQDLIRVLDLGVHGYLLKECDEEEFVCAVHAIAKGEKFFCGRVMDSILEKITPSRTKDDLLNSCMPVSLSNREVEVVRLIADGLTTKDIANKLHLSFFTIGTHRKNIFRKLQVRNSSELILHALKEGIIRAQVG